MFKKITDNIALVQNESNNPIIFDVQSALDLIATTWHECDCTRLILIKKDIAEDFFDLRTGIAGDVLQKFVNYGFRTAIVGDFEGYASKSLKDFIYESNKGKVVYFTNSIEDATVNLSKE